MGEYRLRKLSQHRLHDNQKIDSLSPSKFCELVWSWLSPALVETLLFLLVLSLKEALMQRLTAMKCQVESA